MFDMLIMNLSLHPMKRLRLYDTSYGLSIVHQRHNTPNIFYGVVRLFHFYHYFGYVLFECTRLQRRRAISNKGMDDQLRIFYVSFTVHLCMGYIPHLHIDLSNTDIFVCYWLLNMKLDNMSNKLLLITILCFL